MGGAKEKMMNKKGVATEVIVGLVILIAIGIGVGGSLISSVTNYNQVTNEEHTFTTGTATAGYNNTITLTNKPAISGTLTVKTGLITLAETTNYTFNYANSVYTPVKNTTSAKLNFTYQYEQTGYVRSNTARTVIQLIIVFLAIGALMFVAKEVGMGQ